MPKSRWKFEDRRATDRTASRNTEGADWWRQFCGLENYWQSPANDTVILSITYVRIRPSKLSSAGRCQPASVTRPRTPLARRSCVLHKAANCGDFQTRIPLDLPMRTKRRSRRAQTFVRKLSMVKKMHCTRMVDLQSVRQQQVAFVQHLA